MKVSTMIHAHHYEVVDHVNAHEEKKTIVPTRHQVTESREAEKPKAAAAAAQQGTEPGSFVSQYGMITAQVQGKVVDRLKLVYILMSASTRFQ